MRRKKPFPVHIVVFLAPAVLIYTAFMIYPLIDTLRLSLYTFGPERQEIFVGLANYQRLFSDDQWAPFLRNAIENNVIFFAVHMLFQNPIGLLLAALLASRFLVGSAIYRTLIFTPTVLSIVLVGFIWRLILSPVWGVSEDVLGLFGLAHLDQPWLGLESTALVTLSLVSVWQFVGIPMLLFLAALVGIPDELVEAARVDGATGWDVFWRIKFPLILPTVGIVGILTFVNNFNAFDLIYTTQRALAGPNFATDILGTFFFRTFFGVQLQPGNPIMGATIAGVMFLIILTGVLIYFFGYQRRLQRIEL
ncbi:MAG: sugar ABC transporter permease [Trueperaceae bacterium]|nr:sugar ABC transporter permease [Trueperaceae bacterium]